MATETTGGGSTTSFTNTPQAKDDYYAFLEDYLRNNSSIYCETTKILTLDVMANDLGGSAKTLFSVEDGDGNPITADFDLLCKDVNAAGISNWECTFGGNWVRINNGKIEYVIADGSGIPGQGRSVDSLTDGQNFSDQFVYAIRLGNGTLSEATVKINITGKQDAASIAVSGASDNCVVEAGGVANGTAGDPSAGGTLIVSDADLGQNKFQAPAASALAGTYGNFTFDETSGEWEYTLDNSRPATEALAEGQTKTESLTVWSQDGSASYVINVTVKGTNDAPVAVADTGATTENAAVSVDVLANDTDADDGAVLSLVGASAPAGKGSASIVAGKVQFDPGTAFDHLAAGATEQVVISYTMQDEHGVQSSSTLTITVTGTNDGPVAVDDTGAGNEDSTITGSVATNDSDPDDGASLSYAIIGSAPAGFSLNPNGGWILDASNTAYQHLAAGATTVVTVSYTVSDGLGGSDIGELKITVTGVNDDPALTGAQATLAAGTEDQNYIVSKLSLLQGFTDVDDGAVLDVGGLTANHGTVINNGDGTFTIQPELNYNGPVTLSYNVVDGLGGSVAATLQFNLAAVNDLPAVSGDLLGEVTEAGMSNAGGDPTATGTAIVEDVDNPDVFLPASGASDLGFGTYSIDADGNWSYTLDNDNPAVKGLNDGDTLEDHFLIYSDDGTPTQITITIHGANDGVILPPVYAGDDDPNNFDTKNDIATGTSLVTGSEGDDNPINDASGAHTIRALGGNDTVNAGNGGDTVYGGSGADIINGGDGNDFLYGQAGDDIIHGDGNNDEIYGGSGNDQIFGDDNSDQSLYGGSGNDIISGGANADRLIGGFGADELTGGANSDTFVFLDVRDTGDTITDYTPGPDTLDFTAIDANPFAAGNQQFEWGGTEATAFGIWFAQVGSDTILYADTDGDAATAEFMLTLENFSGFADYADPDTPPPLTWVMI